MNVFGIAEHFHSNHSVLERRSLAELTRDIAKTNVAVVQFRGDNTEQLRSCIKAIRQHSHPRVYLMPLVLLYDDIKPPSALRLMFDDCINISTLKAIGQVSKDSHFERIEKWIDRIPNLDDNSSDTSLPFKILRLLASRKGQLQPVLTPSDPRGFIYPAIEPFFEHSDDSPINILAFLHVQQFLGRTFFKRAHFCPSCESAFLNFIEVCPDCGAEDLEKEELVHHFKCGHVDGLHHFKRNNQLECPKCNERLKHIGVDYDKPSIVYVCHQCTLQFQDPLLKTQCYTCESEANIEDVSVEDIFTYNISAIGLNAALFGLDALFTSILQTDLQLYSNREFQSFIHIEKARIARYKKSTSCIATIYIENLETIFTRLGKRTEQLFKEISAVFKTVFRESDVISALNESVFVILMTETSDDNANLALHRLKNAIQELFTANLAEELSVGIATNVHQIHKDSNLNEMLEEILQAHEQ